MNAFNEPIALKSQPWVDCELKLSIYRLTHCDKPVSRSLRQAIEQRMRDSSLGSFLWHLNRSQQHEAYVQCDKLDRLIFDIGKNLIDLDKFGRQNDICDDLLALIEKLLENNEPGKITIKSSLRGTKLLRLTGSHIIEMDDSIKDLSKLQALVLAGNCLSQVPGECLPKGLMVLELCYNNLQDLSSLLQDCPPYLLYLGLARNYISLTQDMQSQSLNNLYHLDLSQNNIDDLRAVVSDCLHLDNLCSLLLIGNPCSMVAAYKDFIASRLLNLSLLDGVSIKTCTIETGTELDLSGSLQFTFYRLLSFPQPPNQKINKKKVVHSFRIEVDCPMLRAFVPKIEENFVEDSTLNALEIDKQKKTSAESKKAKQQKENQTGSKADPNKNKDSKQNIKNKSEKSADKKRKSKLINNTNSKEDLERSKEMAEYESFRNEQLNTELCFISGSKSWNKIIEFDDPTIEIPNCNLISLRDTFRSYLIINVVHLKTLPANKRKGSGKKKQKKSIANNINDNINKDILVSKTTVAKVRIPLQDIVWNLQTLDYVWCMTKPSSVEQASGLKYLKYSVTNKKGNKPIKGKGEQESLENKLPTVFTCHFGIGVKRKEIV